MTAAMTPTMVMMTAVMTAALLMLIDGVDGDGDRGRGDGGAAFIKTILAIHVMFGSFKFS